MRRVPTKIKKQQGTLNVTRDRDTDFILVDGVILGTPTAPDDFEPWLVKEWNIVWRHLIAHEYGKEADVKLVEVYCREMGNYFKFSKFGQTYGDGIKAFNAMMKASEALGLNPAAMAKVAILQKKNKKENKLDEMLKKAMNEDT